MKNRWILGTTMGLLMAVPSMGYAMERNGSGAKYTLAIGKAYTPSVWTSEARYIDRVKEKLVFGGKNTLLGWLELYNEPRDAVRANGRFLAGMGHGLKNMLCDTLGGAVHLATFPITAVDVPLPEGGTDLL